MGAQGIVGRSGYLSASCSPWGAPTFLQPAPGSVALVEAGRHHIARNLARAVAQFRTVLEHLLFSLTARMPGIYHMISNRTAPLYIRLAFSNRLNCDILLDTPLSVHADCFRRLNVLKEKSLGALLFPEHPQDYRPGFP